MHIQQATYIIDMATEDSVIVKLELDVDIGAKSSMFCCMICFDLIQRPAEHRQCGNTICTGCVARLTKPNSCPSCRASVEFISNSLIHKTIYPKVSRPCTNAECKQILFNIGAHERVCKYRFVDCPVCHVKVALLTIHDHLARDCALPYPYSKGYAATWDTVLRCNWSEFERELLGVDKLEKAPYFQTFDLNPAGFKQTALTTRILYFWRKGSRDCSYINMMCIQLSASPDESIGYATTKSGEVRSMTIASIGNFEDVVTSVETGDRIPTYKKIELDAGIHLLAYNNTYEIKLDDFMMNPFARLLGQHSSWVGNLIEILHTPEGVSRAVFVDRYGDTKTVEMNAVFMSKVKKVTAPSTGVPSEDDFQYPSGLFGEHESRSPRTIRMGDTFPGRRLPDASPMQHPRRDEPYREHVNPSIQEIRDSYLRATAEGAARMRRTGARQSSMNRVPIIGPDYSILGQSMTGAEIASFMENMPSTPFAADFDGDAPDASLDVLRASTRQSGVLTTSRVGEMASSNMGTAILYPGSLNRRIRRFDQEDATRAAARSILGYDPSATTSDDDSDDEIPTLESTLNDEYPEPRAEHRISEQKMRSWITGDPTPTYNLPTGIMRPRGDIFTSGRHDAAGLFASAFTSAMMSHQRWNNPGSRISHPSTDARLLSELFTAMLTHGNNPPALTQEPTEGVDVEELD